MKTILLAEDDEMVSRMYERAFNFAGYEIRTVDNGAQVMDTLHAMEPLPGAIILDMVMPNRNGSEILKDIRADARYDTVPIVVLTNSIREGQGQELLGVGADLFLIKMDNQAKDVVQRVQELINKGRSVVRKV